MWALLTRPASRGALASRQERRPQEAGRDGKSLIKSAATPRDLRYDRWKGDSEHTHTHTHTQTDTHTHTLRNNPSFVSYKRNKRPSLRTQPQLLVFKTITGRKRNLSSVSTAIKTCN